ncbi:putative OHCU decarboxylase [Streptomyces bingchenggensis BCW-1]|uniref:2-oxo-4-hydroxy-4-carboxy-5-ureidoimidazoline decarboxylase n=1 Tax=Streptomyces bingchenggensis (strain BCW-1) TaxID=749414 RepID=D7BZ91_STRBB|nr:MULTISPECIES: 2-oxo-4-hydroxy-4-carboxy-5-ureidoimidazoline decarboxylase [Streptomyces]ADI07827.1 putative OHCU decarboxylase [Streptomyces bingchenggensis BCW-1]
MLSTARLARLARLNAASAGAAEDVLLACCGSRRWARLLVAHRPYPDLDALLAAGDEASYDLTPADLDEALADEAVVGQLAAAIPMDGAGARAALTALRAAHTEYERRFGHVFVICLDGLHPDEMRNRVLAEIHARLDNERDAERVKAAEELRRIARGRLARLIAGQSQMSGIKRFHPA